MRIYALSDPHGCLDVLEQALSVVDLENPENRLYLLGDYVPHKTFADEEADFVRRCTESLSFVKALCEAHPDQVVALKGNHEDDLLEDVVEGRRSFGRDLERWMRGLPLFEETEWQVYVHAGIDEEAGDLWHVGTDEECLLRKYPPSFGAFHKDIVAGHTGTFKISRENGEAVGFNGALWDGQSHYLIDGSTERSGIIPILRFDTATRQYAAFSATAEGVKCDGAPYVPAGLENPDAHGDYDDYGCGREDDWR